MSLQALPGKRQLTRRHPPRGLADPVGGREGTEKPQGENSDAFQVHSQTGLCSSTDPRVPTKDGLLGLVEYPAKCHLASEAVRQCCQEE